MTSLSYKNQIIFYGKLSTVELSSNPKWRRNIQKAKCLLNLHITNSQCKDQPHKRISVTPAEQTMYPKLKAYKTFNRRTMNKVFNSLKKNGSQEPLKLKVKSKSSLTISTI